MMVLTMARMVWTEMLRKRMFWVTVGLTVIFLALYWYAVVRAGDGTGLDPLTRFLKHGLWLSLGLYMANLIVAYVAIFSAAGTISAELENGLLLAILPRPIHRWQVYIGKWLAYMIWSGLYGAAVYWAVVAISSVTASVPMEAASLWRGFAVFELIPCTLTGLTVLGSLFLPMLSNGVMMMLAFGIGMIGGFVQRVSATSSPALNKIGLVTSLLIPTNADYYRTVYESMGGPNLPDLGQQLSISLGPFGGGPIPSNAFLVYTLVYMLATVGVGIWRFSRQDL